MSEKEKEKENDSLSVESGSCDCSNYNSDISWFYLSENLKTSHYEFNILIDKSKIKESNKIKEEILENKDLQDIKEQNEIKVNLNKEMKRIEMPKFIRNENNNSTDNLHSNIRKKDTDYRSKYKMALRNNKSLELYLNAGKNKNEINRKETEFKRDLFQDNKKEEEIYIKPQINNRHLTNKVNRNRFFNISIPNNENKNNKNNSSEKVVEIKINKIEEKDKGLDKDTDKNEENKNKINLPKYRRNFFNSYKNVKNFKEKYKKEDDNLKNNIAKNNNEQNNDNQNNQIKGKTLKESVVNEIKNLVLEPGKTIKPKIVTKRKLMPNTKMVTNEDGTQNIITENTTLTTTIINEILDSSEANNDNYPLDIQLVRQHITKTYLTEIENSPYVPKKRFSHFN